MSPYTVVMIPAHAFRGEFLDLCAQIEQWALERIRQVGDDSKTPYLFGQKLKRVGELAADDTVFSRPARVRELLDRLKPFAELRSKLAHSVMQPSSQAADAIYAFEVAGAPEPPDHAGRFWLRTSDMAPLICELKKIRKELSDQKVKALPPSKAPPDQSPHAGPQPHPPVASGTSAPSHS
jgi:hypothetical protein